VVTVGGGTTVVWPTLVTDGVFFELLFDTSSTTTTISRITSAAPSATTQLLLELPSFGGVPPGGRISPEPAP
jgi:hypothetical protein